LSWCNSLIKYLGANRSIKLGHVLILSYAPWDSAPFVISVRRQVTI
jgi:hypothetical protein